MRPPRRRLLADISPLRESRDFRLLFFGNAISYLGRQLTVVAIPFQVYLITNSSLAVGLTGLASLGPLVVMSLLGGSIADAVDRRKLLLLNVVAQAATSVALAVNATLDHPALWPLYVLGALNAGLWGIDLPTRNAMVPAMVSREKFPAAAALGQLVFQLGQVAGPALAGIVISQVDLAAAYWIDAASYGAAFVALLLIQPQPPEGGGTKAGLASVKEGLSYLKGRRLLLSTFLIDINAMVFGMPRALFPALAPGLYGGGATTVGLLYAAPGAGALLGALFTGWVGGVRRQGRVVVVSVLLWGAAIAGFGLVPWLPLGLFLLAAGGGGRRGQRRLPQHDPADERARRAPGPAQLGPHRGRHRRSGAGRRRGGGGGCADHPPGFGSLGGSGLHARRAAAGEVGAGTVPVRCGRGGEPSG